MMSTTHRISTDFYDDDFQLIAIHSDLEDYAMGYALNSSCKLHLQRMEGDLKFDENLTFSAFDWNDELNDTYWTLVSNKCTVEETLPMNGLFKNNTSVRTDYLIGEHREVDYFLKVDNDNGLEVSEQIRAINKIPRVITAYQVDTQTLKSKRNLIF